MNNILLDNGDVVRRLINGRIGKIIAVLEPNNYDHYGLEYNVIWSDDDWETMQPEEIELDKQYYRDLKLNDIGI